MGTAIYTVSSYHILRHKSPSKIHDKDTDVTYQPNGPNWPSLLDSFSLIAGQIATLIKYLKAPNTPVLG